MFAYTVIIAGDGPRANVHLLADVGIAQIGEVIRLRTFSQLDFLGLHEIPEMSVLSYVAPRTHVGVRSKNSAVGHPRIFHNGARLHHNVIPEDGIANNAVRADAAIGPDLRIA